MYFGDKKQKFTFSGNILANKKVLSASQLRYYQFEMQFDMFFQNMVSIFVPSFCQKKLERKNDKKGKIGHEPKKFLPFFSSNLESVDRKTPGTNFLSL